MPPHFTDEEAKAQESEATCPRPQTVKSGSLAPSHVPESQGHKSSISRNNMAPVTPRGQEEPQPSLYPTLHSASSLQSVGCPTPHPPPLRDLECHGQVGKGEYASPCRTPGSSPPLVPPLQPNRIKLHLHGCHPVPTCPWAPDPSSS